jgi:hypothetical protein
MDSKKYIGMDVHKESISIAVRNAAGKIVMECVIETKASMILQFIDGLRGDLQVTFKEGTSARSNRRRMTHLTVDPQFFHQVQKPLHRSGRFDAYTHRTWKRGIKLPHAVAFVRQSPAHNFSCRGV